MKYAFIEYRPRENTAFNKAPEDVLRIAGEMGYAPCEVKALRWRKRSFLRKVIYHLPRAFVKFRIMRRLRCAEVVLLQATPVFLFRRVGRAYLRKLHRRGVRFVYVIHDIGELRQSDPLKIAQARDSLDFMLDLSDVLIAHNARMKDWLVARGYPQERIVELGIFDYLCDPQAPLAPVGEKLDVIVAGNLSADKAAYLSELKSVRGVNWKLYGPNFEPDILIGRDSTVANIEYCGSFAPDELPLRLSGAWGLVWDGDSIHTCSGTTGSYLRYINSHKLSLFLACGIPVIIWSEAAAADFVRSHQVGITVSSLSEIPLAIAKLSEAEIRELRQNAVALSRQLRTGSYSRQALAAAEGVAGNLFRGVFPCAP